MELLLDDGRMRVGRLVVNALENNVYIVSCSRTNEAVIIDAASDADRILSATEDLTISAVLTTHGHHDHVGAVARVTETLDIPFRMHEADSSLAGRVPDKPLVDNEQLIVGELTLSALHTPGHTPGSMSFLTGDHLFTGDTLFPGGPGATRFAYSDFDTIMRSLDERLFTHGDSTLVYPGHGASTTLGTERPHLEEWRSRRW